LVAIKLKLCPGCQSPTETASLTLPKTCHSGSGSGSGSGLLSIASAPLFAFFFLDFFFFFFTGFGGIETLAKSNLSRHFQTAEFYSAADPPTNSFTHALIHNTLIVSWQNMRRNHSREEIP